MTEQNNKEYELLSLVYKEDENYKIERVKIVKYGQYYQLKGIPAFANGLAYNDIISVEEDDEGQLFLDEVIEASGHSVVQIAVLNEKLSMFILSSLEKYGVFINKLHNNSYLVIDISKNVPYKELRKFLIDQIELENISVNEATLSDIHYAQIESDT